MANPHALTNALLAFAEIGSDPVARQRTSLSTVLHNALEGAAKLETPGLNLKAIEVKLPGEGDGGIRLAAHAASGEGELNLDGTADLAGKATDADIKIKGQNFRVINTIEAKVDASPDLSIALRGNRVDEAGSNSSPEEASFVIGKYLTPKLYVSYELGLFDPVSTARLQYAINSRWKLVTESSGIASGGDVIYTIETGK